jgi:hypothetical protein
MRQAMLLGSQSLVEGVLPDYMLEPVSRNKNS